MTNRRRASAGFAAALATALVLAVPAFGAAPGNPVVSQTPVPLAGLGSGKAPPRGGVTPVPRKRRGLPYTGTDLGLFTVVGLALIGSGFLLRLTARN